MKRRSILCLALAATLLCALPIAGCGDSSSSDDSDDSDKHIIDVHGYQWYNGIEDFIAEYVADDDPEALLVRKELFAMESGEGFTPDRPVDYGGRCKCYADKVDMEAYTLQNVQIEFKCVGFSIGSSGVREDNWEVRSVNYDRRYPQMSEQDYHISVDGADGILLTPIDKPPKDPASLPTKEELAWKALFNDLLESGVSGSNVIEAIADSFYDFELKKGKYTAEEISVDENVTCTDAEVTLDEEEKLALLTYDLRYEDKTKRDVHVTVTAEGEMTSTEIPKLSDYTKMSESQWSSNVTAFVELTDCTVTREDAESGETVKTMCLDGGKYSETSAEGTRIWAKDEGLFYTYTKLADAEEWSKAETTKEDYDAAVATVSGADSANSFAMLAMRAVQSKYHDFTFEKGVYTLEGVLQSGDYRIKDIKDIEITVSAGSFIRVVYTLVGGYGEGGADELVTIDKVGSTLVSLPRSGGAADAEEQENAPND